LAVSVGVALGAAVAVLVGLLVGGAVFVAVGGGGKLSESPHATRPFTISRHAKEELPSRKQNRNRLIPHLLFMLVLVVRRLARIGTQ
ncbi:MAG TPA: hypothetical protein VMT89_12490, partial [Candidatus Acidoferrales bacterium]|nr:hypothetical protein [Candidatus Acidoferrales bacterium]